MLRHCFVFICVFIFGNSASAQYDASLVKTTTLVYEGDEFQVVQLSRANNRIKVKYFAAKDFVNNKSIIQRFNDWKMGRN